MKKLQKKVPEWGPEKSSGICSPGWGFGPSFGPDLIFKSGQKHQKWPKMGPESMVWAEHRSRIMPGPLRSVWDGSNPLKGAVPGPKSQKECPKTARNIVRHVWNVRNVRNVRNMSGPPEHCSGTTQVAASKVPQILEDRLPGLSVTHEK